MGQTLPHGVYLPDNGERNCYTGLSQNWQKLDNLIGSHGDTVSFAQTLTEGVEIGKITINGTEISMFHTDYSGKANASDVYTKAEADTLLNEKAKASDLTTHTSDTNIHVTTTDKAKWNGKQDALSSQQIANINDVVNKANDSEVVHKSGDTMSGDLCGNGSNNLGTSTNKWKTINGINPGALSLPSMWTDNYSNNLVYNNLNSSYTFEMPYDGWLSLRVQGAGCSDGNFYLLCNVSREIRGSTEHAYSGILVPALTGDFIDVYCPAIASGTGVQLCLFKCKGNV